MDHDETITPAVGEVDVLRCPGCGYDLRATGGDRCSECGETFDREELRKSAFPWDSPGKRGFKGYWLTVWRVSVDARSLAHEAHKAQNLAAVKWFGVLTVVLVSTVLAGLFAAAVASGAMEAMVLMRERRASEPPGWALDIVLPWSAGVTLWPTMPVCLVVLAICVLRTAERFVDDAGETPQRRERAMAIARYAVSPMALLVVPAGLRLVLWGITRLTGSEVASAMFYLPRGARLEQWGDVVWLLCLVPVGLTVVRTMQWMTRLRRCDGWVVMLAVFALLGAWLVEGIVLLGLVPWCVGFLWVVFASVS